MENTKDIEIVKADQFGVSEQQEKELLSNLPQIKSERDALIPQFDEIIKMDIEEPETASLAKSLRLLFVKNRTQGINKWHSAAKEYFLKGGQFVDAIRRKEVAVNERMEADLMAIEKHAEIKEQKRLEAQQLERAKRLSKYVEDASERDLNKFEDDEFEALLEAKKREHEEKIEAARIAEEERIAREKAEAEERERIKIENERLRKEAEEREAKAEAERLDRERLAKIEADKRAKEEADRKAKEEADRKARAEKERKEREAHEAELRKERERQAELEAKLKAKEEADRKAREAEEARIQAELSKGDEDKVKDLISDLDSLKSKYSFDSEKNKKMYNSVSILIDKIVLHIEEKI